MRWFLFAALLLPTQAFAAYTRINADNIASKLSAELDANGQLITDRTDALELGTACTGGGAGDVCTGGDLHVEGDLVLSGSGTVPVRTRVYPIPVNLWVHSGGAPPTTASSSLGAALIFDDTADDRTSFSFRVPGDYDGASDIDLRLRWSNQSGTAIADTETVNFFVQYRSRATGETTTGGTAATANTTYTQSGAGTDLETHETAITLDYDGASQPLAAGDLVLIELRRDVSEDNYAADAVVYDTWLEYQSTELAVE